MSSRLEACAECKRKCLLCHQKKRSSTPLVSSFFKVMIPNRFSEVLFLPPKFAARASSLIGQEVPLEDSSGLQWKVKLNIVENSLAFNQGWDMFARHHRLEVGDFVIFHYILGSHFVVQIFDRTGCEKLDFVKKKSQNKRAKADRNSTTEYGPDHVTDKGSADQQGSKTSVFFKSNVETSHRQCELRDVKNVKMAAKGASIDKKGVARSQAVSKAEIFEEPCLGKRKKNDPINVKMPVDSGSSNKNRLPRPQAVPKAGVFHREFDGKDAKYQTANLDTVRTYNLDTTQSKKITRAKDSSHKPSQEIPPVDVSKFAWSELGGCQTDEGREKANSGKKPKVKLEQNDSIFNSPVGRKDIFHRKAKVEAIDTDRSRGADRISCLVEANKSYLALPAALPSSYERRSKSVVLLRGPKLKLCPVLYHETPERKVLMGGWDAFCQYNNILPGDECTFAVENAAENIFGVTVTISL